MRAHLPYIGLAHLAHVFTDISIVHSVDAISPNLPASVVIQVDPKT